MNTGSHENVRPKRRMRSIESYKRIIENLQSGRILDSSSFCILQILTFYFANTLCKLHSGKPWDGNFHLFIYIYSSYRIARAGPRSEPTVYEYVRLDGCFLRADSAPRGLKESTFPCGLQLIRRARIKDDAIPSHTISGNDIVSVFFNFK